ncbi:prolyl oligopeptidase family serine peptidase [Alteromonas sp. 5E99-2]|uniref:prolyl oligopeptidase family serine peptidase n=1 Tax=Alteromonas sp. 5E99-2 TaxID=2817683 RepID=UPI00325BA390
MSITACNEKASQPEPEAAFTYPTTKKQDVVDVYFDEKVADPYRWLEDDRSEKTAQWVKTQNALTQSFLEGIPYKQKISQTLSDLINYEKVGTPFKEGNYIYIYKNDGLQNQYVLYRSKSDSVTDNELEVFLDPNTFSEDGTKSMSNVSFSEDGGLAAYQTSDGGSDWREIVIVDTETKLPVSEPLIDVKFSGISWVGNDGFYYSSYDKPDGSELSAKTDQHKLYYHKIGTPQADDIAVFGHTDAQKHRYVGATVSEDNRYLLISASVSTSGNKLYLQDLSKPDAPLVTVLDHTDSDTYLLHNTDDTLFFITNLNAPNSKIVKVNANAPTPDKWEDLIPETENVLEPSFAGNSIFALYIVDATTQVKQYSLEGKLIRNIELPGIGSAGGFNGKTNDETTFFRFTNYKTPSTSYSFDIATGKTEVFNQPKTAFKPDNFVSSQVFYTSKDGTKVPMMITHHKDTKLDGSNPTILYGYGGFNISLTPSFRATVAAWLELGGVYAVANIRGGGEYGKEWHDAGTQMKKQNVFDDFIAAAEYLIDTKYTSSDYLALNGGSNGGLLVGAVMTQRPDMFKVAIPQVGVLDMLRYHTFTAGAGWAYDYGTSEQSKEMYEYLKAYSPVHNVKEGVQYPATLITTADHDDRVVPAHSFKFAAELQSKQTGPNPTMIRIESDAGHGAGTPTSKVIEQFTDIYGFILYNMGIESL